MDDIRISKEMCYLLRHNPSAGKVEMDHHGWVKTEDLVKGLNIILKSPKVIMVNDVYRIVKYDEKSRYVFKENKKYIRCCHGHTIPGIELDLLDVTEEPPEILYHGTTVDAFEKIKESGFISKMNRHGVHMTTDLSKAIKSASRWKSQVPIVLFIDVDKLVKEQKLYLAQNNVYITDNVPFRYISGAINPDSNKYKWE